MTPSAPEKPSRKTGVAHFFAAASYSAAGVRRALRESAFRQETALGIVALIVIAVARTPLLYALGFFVLWLILLAMEALNTAVETLVDHLSPEWSEFARDAKDLASLAVAALLVANGAYLLYLIWMSWAH